MATQEMYLRMYTTLPWLMLLLAGTTLACVALAALTARFPEQGEWVGRFLSGFVVATVAWHWSRSMLPSQYSGLPSAMPFLLPLGMLLGFGTVRLREPIWRRLWPMLTAVLLIMAAVPLVVGPLLARPFVWPPLPATPGPQQPPAIFLLLDEMGASAAAPIVEGLRAQGWDVQAKSVGAVGDMTVKVIPQMLSGLPFPNARPCGPTTVCDQAYSLDFRSIALSRRDVDIVGFYHPYCAIQGLRWCRRLSPAPALWSPTRWKCAALRTMHVEDPMSSCQAFPLARWTRLVDDVLQSVEEAPFWQQGGLLYAHVPLPHPPGAEPGGSLSQHYSANLSRVRDVVLRLATKARARFGTQVRLVIFSDHGLRYQYACSTPLYAGQPCDLPPTYTDTRVPIIVAGLPANLDMIANNGQVFLLSR